MRSLHVCDVILLWQIMILRALFKIFSHFLYLQTKKIIIHIDKISLLSDVIVCKNYLFKFNQLFKSYCLCYIGNTLSIYLSLPIATKNGMNDIWNATTHIRVTKICIYVYVILQLWDWTWFIQCFNTFKFWFCKG